MDDMPLPCPSCRTLSKLSSFAATSPPLLKGLVDSLEVFCPAFDKGCNWTGERSTLGYHLRKDCQWMEATKGRVKGEDEISSVECSHCQETMAHNDMSNHLDKDCAEIIVSCPMAIYGCSWKGPRAALSREEDEIQTSQAHRCALLPLRPFLEATQARLQALEDDNSALHREAEDARRAQQESQEQLRACVQALGKWVGSNEAAESFQATRDRRTSDLPARGEDGIEWPFENEIADDALEVDLEAGLQRTRSASSASSTQANGSQARPPRRSSNHAVLPSCSRLESTIGSLSATTSTLSTQQRDLSQLVHDSRRESAMAAMEVARLADEMTGFRIALHNVARHVQGRGAGVASPLRTPVSSAAAAAQGSKHDPSGSAQAEQAAKATGPTVPPPATEPGAAAAASPLAGGGGGGGGPLHHHHYYIPHHQHPSHHLHPLDMPMGIPLYGPLPYGVGHDVRSPPGAHPLSMPGYASHPGMRRYWSGFEQTKL